MDFSLLRDPSYLKKLSIQEMEKLAGEIRRFLIESVSKTGGHLSSNLGVVELTIALHYVFNSPIDKIFFDVGHQCYVHKILTGRAPEFAKLRQFNGLSGFQKRCESKHDVWEAGHSSTSLSAALGMAVARDLNHEHYHVVPVIGDGSMSSGMSLEALNQIGDEKRNLIIVFNDNNMSISQNVGALTQGFAKLRSSTGYTTFKTDLKSRLDKNTMGKTVLKSMTKVKDFIKHEVVDSGIFEEFGLEYMGPVDGHDIKSLIQILEVAKKHEGPVVVHVLTKKGKGYPYCENDSEGKWHGVSSFNVQTGSPYHTIPQGHLSWSQIVTEPLVKKAKVDERICAITPAMITGSKLEKFFALYPERSFDCGIAEEHAATFAASLALSGKRPFLCLYSSFLQRAYDQIIQDISMLHLHVVLAIDRAGLVGDDGPTHHGVFDVGFLRQVPGMKILAPVSLAEQLDLLRWAVQQYHGPVAIRYPRGTEGSYSASDWNGLEGELVKCHRTGKDVTILTYGNLLDNALEAAEILADSGVEATVLRMLTLSDLAADEVLAKMSEKKVLILAEEVCGGSGIREALAWEIHQKNPCCLIDGIDLGRGFVPHGSLKQLHRHCGLDAENIAIYTKAVLSK